MGRTVMPVAADELKKAIETGIPGAVAAITPLASDNDHYAAVVTSPAFEGMSRVDQHRLVHTALQHIDLHALSLTTVAGTPNPQTHP